MSQSVLTERVETRERKALGLPRAGRATGLSASERAAEQRTFDVCEKHQPFPGSPPQHNLLLASCRGEESQLKASRGVSPFRASAKASVRARFLVLRQCAPKSSRPRTPLLESSRRSPFASIHEFVSSPSSSFFLLSQLCPLFGYVAAWHSAPPAPAPTTPRVVGRLATAAQRRRSAAKVVAAKCTQRPHPSTPHLSRIQHRLRGVSPLFISSPIPLTASPTPGARRRSPTRPCASSGGQAPATS